MDKIRSRFAPSPTGYLHIGTLRTALYEYAFAKSRNGEFILRIEDTDRHRFVPGSAEKIYEQLKIFGISWDEGPTVGGPFAPYVQSERVKIGIYQKYANQLLEDGHAFYCFCKPRTKEEIEKVHADKISEFRDDKCRNLTPMEIQKKIASGEKPAIRLKTPDNETVSFYDIVVKKEISWNTKFVDDAMLLKSDGFPTYQLAVVVDDAAMKITHIIRAIEWLPSTPIHLLLFKYLGFSLPEIGHLTDILDPNGGKLSKRKGNVSTEDFLAMGYLPQAILNFIMLIGWAPKDNREMYTIEEFVKNFDPNGLQKANAVFHREKLDWFNGIYIRQMDDQNLIKIIEPFVKVKIVKDNMKKSIALIKDRLVKLLDINDLLNFLEKIPDYPREWLMPEGTTEKQVEEILDTTIASLSHCHTADEFEQMGRKMAAEMGLKAGVVFMVLRVGICGSKFTPPLWPVIEILGQEESLARLRMAKEKLLGKF